MKKSTQQKIMIVLTSVMLALTYFAAGFGVCVTFPQVTEEMSKATSTYEISPFSEDQLVELAVTTRNFTVDGGDREGLLQKIADANTAAGTPYAGESAAEIANAPDQYTLSEAALDHLEDVHDLFSRLTVPLYAIACLAVFCLTMTIKMFGRTAASKELLASGIGLLIVFGIVGAWAAFSFSSLFSFIHSLFFKAGTWTFPYDSLLITMYPGAFWAGMGGLWLGVTCILCILSIILGILVSYRIKHAKIDD